MSSALGSRYYTPNAFEVDGNGVPIVGAQLFFYQTGTSTPLNTYSDATLLVPNPNPVVSDSTGHFGSIFLVQTTAYKISCYGPNPDPLAPSTPADPQGVQLWTFDPCGPAASGAGQNVQGIIGEIRMFAGPALSIPSQWYACYGQAVSRASYAAAFSVLGTTWGVGDGVTTFNLPDFRGRLGAGLDNMGGVAASRITSGVCGVPGATLGGVGGTQNAQQDTLTASSTVTIADPGHLHSVSPTGISGLVGSGTFAATSQEISNQTEIVIDTATTGITATATTTVTSGLTGTSQNVQPTAMVNMIIYLGD